MKKIFLLISILSLCCLSFASDEMAQTATPDKSALSVIFSRKSVRTYTDQPVSKGQLMILLKAGMAAPTAMDRRPWCFVVVTDKEALSRLGELSPYGGMVKKAQAAIIVCGIPEKSLPGEGNEYWVQDCSAATENILLAAEALGLGAVWTGAYPIKERVNELRAELGIPENIVPLNMIPIGYPGGNEKPKDKFDESNIHWEKW